MRVSRDEITAPSAGEDHAARALETARLRVVDTPGATPAISGRILSAPDAALAVFAL
jgi:hypothetical protein